MKESSYRKRKKKAILNLDIGDIKFTDDKPFLKFEIIHF